MEWAWIRNEYRLYLYWISTGIVILREYKRGFRYIQRTMTEQHIILHIIVKSKLDDGFCYLGYDNGSNRILRPLASVDSSTARCKPFTKTELYERKAYKFSYYSSAQENLPKPHGTDDLIVTSAEEVPMKITWDDLVETLFSMASPKLRSTCQSYISTPRSGRITKYYVHRRTDCSSIGLLLTKTLTFYYQFGKKRVKALAKVSPFVEAENAHTESSASEEDEAQGQEQISPSTSKNNKRQYSVAFSDDNNGEPLDADLVFKKRVIESKETDVEENRCTNSLETFLLAKSDETDNDKSNIQNVVPTRINETKCESPTRVNETKCESPTRVNETKCESPTRVNESKCESAECVKLSDLFTEEELQVINSNENVSSHFMTTTTKLQEKQDEASENSRLKNGSTSQLKGIEQGKPILKRDRRSGVTNVEFITESPFSERTEDWSTTYDFPYTAPQIPDSNNLADDKVEKLLMLSMCRPGGGKQPDNCFLIGVGVIERSEKTESS